MIACGLPPGEARDDLDDTAAGLRYYVITSYSIHYTKLYEPPSASTRGRASSSRRAPSRRRHSRWTHEIGDGALNGIEGWGNSELQYYTDDLANAATDGNGNLVITLREADDTQQCFYGTCEYTSARLLSWYKAEFAYGRIESRLLVPDGGSYNFV